MLYGCLARLEFLGKPLAAVGTLESSSQVLWLGQDGAQILPDELVERVSGDIAGSTALALDGAQRVAAPMAHIIGQLGRTGARRRAQTDRRRN